MVRRLFPGGGSLERTRLSLNSLLSRENTGNFIGSGLGLPRICSRNGHCNQCLTSKFPKQRNRELIGPYQGIKSAYQGRFMPDHQITRSPDHQITRSPDHQITRSPDHQIRRSGKGGGRCSGLEDGWVGRLRYRACPPHRSRHWPGYLRRIQFLGSRPSSVHLKGARSWGTSLARPRGN